MVEEATRSFLDGRSSSVAVCGHSERPSTRDTPPRSCVDESMLRFAHVRHTHSEAASLTTAPIQEEGPSE